jgi:hypothetical protein
MSSKAIVLDANILIRAVLGRRVCSATWSGTVMGIMRAAGVLFGMNSGDEVDYRGAKN